MVFWNDTPFATAAVVLGAAVVGAAVASVETAAAAAVDVAATLVVAGAAAFADESTLLPQAEATMERLATTQTSRDRRRGVTAFTLTSCLTCGGDV
jgi:hypothetical protein